MCSDYYTSADDGEGWNGKLLRGELPPSWASLVTLKKM
jgi:hypothetical protein